MRIHNLIYTAVIVISLNRKLLLFSFQSS